MKKTGGGVLHIDSCHTYIFYFLFVCVAKSLRRKNPTNFPTNFPCCVLLCFVWFGMGMGTPFLTKFPDRTSHDGSRDTFSLYD